MTNARRMVSDPLPWNYGRFVREALPQAKALLDMGTGGGESLAKLQSAFPPIVCATEGYEPNFPVARKKLEPLGVQVAFFADDASLPFEAEAFDLIINQHDSYDPPEVKRLLSPGGRFLTQQVGGRNEELLNERLGLPLDPSYSEWHVTNAAQALRAAGFHIEAAREAMVKKRYTDIGAVVYYLLACPWQAPGFDVKKHRAQLWQMHEEIEARGFLEVEEEYFYIEAWKNPAK
ncbi:class I SAM-dependent methyltransferase [Bacillus sp. FSL W7-1360]